MKCRVVSLDHVVLFGTDPSLQHFLRALCKRLKDHTRPWPLSTLLKSSMTERESKPDVLRKISHDGPEVDFPSNDGCHCQRHVVLHARLPSDLVDCSSCRRAGQGRRSSRRTHRTTTSFPTSQNTAISPATLCSVIFDEHATIALGIKENASIAHCVGCPKASSVRISCSTFFALKPMMKVAAAQPVGKRCLASSVRSTNEALQADLLLRLGLLELSEATSLVVNATAANFAPSLRPLPL